MTPQSLVKALRHLKKDPHLKRVIAKHEKPEFDRGQKGLSPFHALTRAIIYQQLSGKAAATIHTRFSTIYGSGGPTPEKVMKTPLSKIRSAGISAQKATYLKDLASKFLDGTINPKVFARMPDEEIREHVIAVKGVGPWTADMFLIFTLERPDVLPTGDLGIQKGMRKLFNLKTLPEPDTMKKLAAPWAPYRTVACWYLWRVADEAKIV